MLLADKHVHWACTSLLFDHDSLLYLCVHDLVDCNLNLGMMTIGAAINASYIWKRIDVINK